MALTITEHQYCDLIKITGRVDSYTSPQINEEIQTLIEKGCYNFVLELSDVNYLSSSGILMFINLQKQLFIQKNGKIVFSKVPEMIYSNFKLAGFDQLFEFHKDTNAAIHMF